MTHRFLKTFHLYILHILLHLCNRFFKTFHLYISRILLHLFNSVDCLETKIMTKAMDINFISNNVKVFQNSLKRLKIFNYLKENLSYNGLLFLQETHSSSKDEMKWKGQFKWELFFSHGKTNSRGISIGYTRKRSFKLSKKKIDENGRFLILEAMIDDCVVILINLYNPNTEKEQVST